MQKRLYATSLVTALCAACHLPEGGCTVGIGPLFPPPPDPATTVAVVALDRIGEPVAGVDVFGHDADGVMTDQQVTDADGWAYVEVPIGGSITTHEVDSASTSELAVHRW